MPKLISAKKETFFDILILHEERNRHYLRIALKIKETDAKLYGLNIKKLKEVNKEVFDAVFMFLTRYIDDLGLQDLIKVLEVLSSTRYQDAEKISLVESIAERVILVLLKIDDSVVRFRLLRNVKHYCDKLNIADLYEE